MKNFQICCLCSLLPCMLLLACKKDCAGSERTAYVYDTIPIVDTNSTSLYYNQNVAKIIKETKSLFSYPCVGQGKGGFVCDTVTYKFQNFLPRAIQIRVYCAEFPLDSLERKTLVAKKCYETEFCPLSSLHSYTINYP